MKESFLIKWGNSIGAEAARIRGASHDETEIIKYFFVGMINIIAFFVTLTVLSMTISIFTHINVLYFLLLNIIVYGSFVALRNCFGGAHLQSDLLCLIVSVATNIFGAWLAVNVAVPVYIIVAFYLVSYAVVHWTRVIDNAEKRLSPKRKDEFFKKGIMVLFVLLGLNLGLKFLSEEICSAMFAGAALEIVNLIIGKITYK